MDAETILLIVMAFALILALASVFIPISGIASFAVTVLYLIPNVSTVESLRPLVVGVIATSILISFFGVYQVERGS